MTTPAAAGAPSSPSPPPARTIPVLLLKTPSTPTDPYATYFRNHPPFAATFIPVLQHTPIPSALTHLATLLTSTASSSPTYGALIFTSPRAVSSFARALPSSPPPPSPHIYAIGPATTSALRASSPPPASTPPPPPPPKPSPATSSPTTPTRPPPPRARRSSSWPASPTATSSRGRWRRRRCPRASASASTRWRCMRAGRWGGLGEFAAAVARTEAAGVRWVVVFSAVGGRGCCGGWGGWGGGGGEGGDEEGRRRRETYVASIGPTTRDYLRREFGFEVDVCAEEPSPEGVGRGIERFMREKGMW
ncbi:MAG: hypothetical protein FRX48_02358 [Lasallia pustulata]|uniref:Tetrapyrrole biosynthesis uroporphyrinogen III synthase domain-containing protein n=1 Tax=Lasallia pustulata TaxID=136370 RepID=A0A5M8PY68_9LECA|nr:MAG: hypothetical protein FRX48_02358 [Lasallia pustulata]